MQTLFYTQEQLLRWHRKDYKPKLSNFWEDEVIDRLFQQSQSFPFHFSSLNNFVNYALTPHTNIKDIGTDLICAFLVMPFYCTITPLMLAGGVAFLLGKSTINLISIFIRSVLQFSTSSQVEMLINDIFRTGKFITNLINLIPFSVLALSIAILTPPTKGIATIGNASV